MLLAANDVFFKETKKVMEIQTDLPKPPVHTAVQTCTKPKLPPPQNAAATFYLEAIYNLIHISVLLHHHPSIHACLGLPWTS